MAISFHDDSQVAIEVAHNSMYKPKKRHIRIRHSTAKQMKKLGVISLEYMRSERNLDLADPLIKGLTR